MIDPLPIWCILTNRDTMYCHSMDGPILFVTLDEALKGIDKIAKRFRQATLLATFRDGNDRDRFRFWKREDADGHPMPEGAITYRYLKDNERKIRGELATGNGATAAKKTRKPRKKAAATAPTVVDDEKQTIAMLQQDCRDLGIKYHHKNKAEKLRELLKAAGEPATV